MTLDPQLVTLAALALAIAWTMTFSALAKNVLEPKHRRRICPSCGRSITGAVCRQH